MKPKSKAEVKKEAYAEYEKARDSARAEYKKIADSAWNEYKKKIRELEE